MYGAGSVPDSVMYPAQCVGNAELDVRCKADGEVLSVVNTWLEPELSAFHTLMTLVQTHDRLQTQSQGFPRAAM